jgi:hypothetical protein
MSTGNLEMISVLMEKNDTAFGNDQRFDGKKRSTAIWEMISVLMDIRILINTQQRCWLSCRNTLQNNYFCTPNARRSSRDRA